MTEPTLQPPRPPVDVSAAEGETRPLKLFIRSFGCQMNAYDASRMADARERGPFGTPPRSTSRGCGALRADFPAPRRDFGRIGAGNP